MKTEKEQGANGHDGTGRSRIYASLPKDLSRHPHCSFASSLCNEVRNFGSVVIVCDGIETCEMQFIIRKNSRTLAAALMFKAIFEKTILE